MSTPALTPEFASALRDTMLGGLANEVETTKKVLAAIPDSKNDYRPEPNARTAWELAWHIANTDIQFLDGIADLNFTMANPAEADKPKPAPNSLPGTTGISSARPPAYAPFPANNWPPPSISWVSSTSRPQSILDCLTTTASIIAVNSRPTSAPWERSVRRFMAPASTRPCRPRTRKPPLPDLQWIRIGRAARRGGFFYRPAQRIGTGYSRISRSAVISVNPSVCAWATSIRSNGSPWWRGRPWTARA